MGDSAAKKWIGRGLSLTIVTILLTTAILLSRKPAFNIDIPGARGISPPARIPSFSLTDQHDKAFTNKSLTGHWTLAMIGYTYCPDICPTTLSEIAALFKQLQGQREKIASPEFVFFSVDPFRDTSEKLRKYLGYFNQDFTGVTGEPEKIHALVNDLGLHYIYADPEDNHFLDDGVHRPAMDDYVVVHSTSLLFITPQGELAATMTPPFQTDAVLTLLQKLHAYYED